VICWVRYSPSATTQTAPAGALVFSLAQDGKPLAEQAVSFEKKEEIDEPAFDDGMEFGDLMDPGEMPRAEETLECERTAFHWIPLRATARQGKITLSAASDKSGAALDCASCLR